MKLRSLTFSLFSLAFLGAGCVAGTSPVGGGSTGVDSGVRPRVSSDPSADRGRDYDPLHPCVTSCGDTEACGDTGEGNGLDDDCDGQVDEGCTCRAPGVTLPCFYGPPDRRGLGACTDGVQTCNEFLTWGPCVGGVSPLDEVCDGVDNDCNGISDEVADCSPALTCPGNDDAAPLSAYALSGSDVYTGTGRDWYWQVECPPSVPASLCPSPEAQRQRDTEVYFTASGAYRVSVSTITDDGQTASCAWTVYVQGSGLRVELNWDTMEESRGGTDLDLHVHRWTQNGVDTPFFGAEDCYYGNCKAEGLLSWDDHPNGELSGCEDAPHGEGADWRDLGYCRNPRLDVDTNASLPCQAGITDPADPLFCAPENVNIDNPIPGMPYRIMVNYYDDEGLDGPTNPTVNIYCGGATRASFGSEPMVLLREGSSTGASNESWLVADVVFVPGVCGTVCEIHPLGNITANPEAYSYELEFGPPWSCDYNATEGTCTL